MEPTETQSTKLYVRALYDTQKLRIQLQLRIDRLTREGIMTDEQAKDFFEVPFGLMQQAEKEMEKRMWKRVRDWPIVNQWLKHVPGIGPRLAGLLVANIAPIDRFDTVSKLWAYAGLAVKDGKAQKRTTGEKSNWNSELKTTVWKIAGSFVKLTSGPYRAIYDNYKARILAREIAAGHLTPTTNDDGTVTFTGVEGWSLGRVNNMAMRYAGKMLLSHLWQVWREIEGLPTREPYPIEKLNHMTFISPWEMVKRNAAED